MKAKGPYLIFITIKDRGTGKTRVIPIFSKYPPEKYPTLSGTKRQVVLAFKKTVREEEKKRLSEQAERMEEYLSKEIKESGATPKRIKVIGKKVSEKALKVAVNKIWRWLGTSLESAIEKDKPFFPPNMSVDSDDIHKLVDEMKVSISKWRQKLFRTKKGKEFYNKLAEVCKDLGITDYVYSFEELESRIYMIRNKNRARKLKEKINELKDLWLKLVETVKLPLRREQIGVYSVPLFWDEKAGQIRVGQVKGGKEIGLFVADFGAYSFLHPGSFKLFKGKKLVVYFDCRVLDEVYLESIAPFLVQEGASIKPFFVFVSGKEMNLDKAVPMLKKSFDENSPLEYYIDLEKQLAVRGIYFYRGASLADLYCRRGRWIQRIKRKFRKKR